MLLPTIVYTVGNTGFTPDPLNVNVGDTVVFMNSGGFHNVNLQIILLGN